MRLDVLVPHLFGLYVNLEIDIETAKIIVAGVAQIFERLRIIRTAFESFRSKRSECLHRHDVWRDRRREILCEKGTERLIFPCLNIASRPVVDETHAEDMILGFPDRDRLTHLIS